MKGLTTIPFPRSDLPEPWAKVHEMLDSEGGAVVVEGIDQQRRHTGNRFWDFVYVRLVLPGFTEAVAQHADVDVPPMVRVRDGARMHPVMLLCLDLLESSGEPYDIWIECDEVRALVAARPTVTKYVSMPHANGCSRPTVRARLWNPNAVL